MSEITEKKARELLEEVRLALGDAAFKEVLRKVLRQRDEKTQLTERGMNTS